MNNVGMILGFIQMNPAILLGIVALLLIAVLLIGSGGSSVGKKGVAAGDQYGSASWMSDKEAGKLYTKVKLPAEIADHSDPKQKGYLPPGRVISYDKRKKEVYVDSSRTHADVEAPTEVGKTSKYVVPNIQYALMSGVNLIVPDIKGELLEKTANDAIKCGYHVYTLDFRVEMMEHSSAYNLMADINDNWQEYIRTGSMVALGKVETFIHSLATDISGSNRGKNENPFFINGAIALIKVAMLLTTMYGSTNQKHFGSIAPLLQEISAMPRVRGISKLATLFKDLEATSLLRRFSGSAYAAVNETEDNLYSSVLGDLIPFCSSAAEQIIAAPQKRSFSWKRLVDEKAVLYIVIPESAKQMYPFVKIIIQQICHNLSDYAIMQPNQRLPRMVRIMWEEFGVSPKIENLDNLMSTCRAHGILFDLIYQDRNQIKKTYGDEIMKIIENQCGTSVILGVAPKNEEEAKRISTILGSQTIASGSSSSSRDNTGHSNRSNTETWMGRELMKADEVMRLASQDKIIVLKRDHLPYLGYLPGYYKKEWALKNEPSFQYPEEDKLNAGVVAIDYLSLTHVREQLLKENKKPVLRPKPSAQPVSNEAASSLEPAKTYLNEKYGINLEEDTMLKVAIERKDRSQIEKVLKEKYNLNVAAVRRVFRACNLDQADV